MTILVLALSLSFQCMLNSLEVASRVEIKRDWSHVTTSSASKKHLRKLLTHAWGEEGPDSRVFALSWLESRLRPVRTGDRGKACGVFQIHARYSYPLFRRKRGFNGWEEKAEESKPLIQRECRKLLNLKYSVDTMRRLLSMMDKRDLHACHHNSGFYGKCNTWYKERASFWISFFSISKWMCEKGE
jgi:hypothetical protein